MQKFSWLAGLFVVTTQVFAGVPSQVRAYQNDDVGITVFKDTQDANIYWFLPQLRLYTENDQVAYRKRLLRSGNTEYTFFIVPYFSDEMRDFVVQELGTIDSKDQLYPVQAKKFAIQIKDYNVLATSDDIDTSITNYQYLNKPQMIRLVLTDEQAEDFEYLYNGAPGMPANVVLYYEGERLKSYATIELTYKEVYDALNVGGSAKYDFLQADIEYAVTNYVANKYLKVVSKGDLKMPEIINKVIEECFTPVTKGKVGKGSSEKSLESMPLEFGAELLTKAKRKGKWLADTERAMRAGESVLTDDPMVLSQAHFKDATEDAVGDDASLKPRVLPPVARRPLNATRPSDPDDESDAKPAGPVKPKGDVKFRFKKELINRTDTFFYQQLEMRDSSEVVVMPAYLTKYAGSQQARTVTKLPTYKGYVSYKATKADPAISQIDVKSGDQLVITAAFQFAADSGCESGDTVRYYQWDSTWPNTDGDFYYRIGDGNWRPVNGRVVVKSTHAQSGALQFYVDREAIWKKIPSDWRENSWFEDFMGVCNIFPRKTSYPEFNVVITGRNVKF